MFVWPAVRVVHNSFLSYGFCVFICCYSLPYAYSVLPVSSFVISFCLLDAPYHLFAIDLCLSWCISLTNHKRTAVLAIFTFCMSAVCLCFSVSPSIWFCRGSSPVIFNPTHYRWACFTRMCSFIIVIVAYMYTYIYGNRPDCDGLALLMSSVAPMSLISLRVMLAMASSSSKLCGLVFFPARFLSVANWGREMCSVINIFMLKWGILHPVSWSRLVSFFCRLCKSCIRWTLILLKLLSWLQRKFPQTELALNARWMIRWLKLRRSRW